MAPGTSDEAAFQSGKSVKAGKDGKSAKEPKESRKLKDENGGAGAGESKNSALLRQLAADLAAISANVQRLQSDVDTLKGLAAPPPTPEAERGRKPNKIVVNTEASGIPAALQSALRGESGSSVVLAFSADPTDGQTETDAPFICTPDRTAVSAVDTTQVAKLGYAFSSVPKVALIRMLLENGEQTAAQLGEGAGLTTGSLYHHLRELVHAEVAFQSNRNRYALTPLGRRAMLALLALQIS